MLVTHQPHTTPPSQFVVFFIFTILLWLVFGRFLLMNDSSSTSDVDERLWVELDIVNVEIKVSLE